MKIGEAMMKEQAGGAAAGPEQGEGEGKPPEEGTGPTDAEFKEQ